jgi:hypothetical protein
MHNYFDFLKYKTCIEKIIISPGFGTGCTELHRIKKFQQIQIIVFFYFGFCYFLKMFVKSEI